jgi:hypothetical protein
MACGGGFGPTPIRWRRKFSGSWAVTSRNGLIHKGATNATWSALLDADGHTPCRSRVLLASLDGALATLNFREFLFFPRTPVNKGAIEKDRSLQKLRSFRLRASKRSEG